MVHLVGVPDRPRRPHRSVMSALLTSAAWAQSGSRRPLSPPRPFNCQPWSSRRKEPADAQSLPLSLTTVAKPTLQNAGIDIVSDAGAWPNLQFSEFTARKLSNARFRGIGASLANPSITTLFDGVPQLNTNTASIDLVDVDQIEFVRGPQSALLDETRSAASSASPAPGRL